MKLKKGISLFGDKELDKLFKTLPDSQKRRIIIDAEKKSSKILVDKAKNKWKGLRKSSGTSGIARSFGIVPAKKIAAIRVGARNFGGHVGYLARFMEGGTRVRRKRGRIRTSRFWSNIVKSNINKIGKNITQELLNSMHKYMRKIIQKHT